MFSKKKTTKEKESENLLSSEPLLRDTSVMEPAPDPSEESENSENSEPSEPSESSEASEPSDLNARIEEAYRIGAGIDDESFAKAKALLDEIRQGVNAATFQPAMLRLALRLMDYDEAISRARAEGIEQGRNEKIAEAFRNRRNAAREAAEIPHFRGTKGMGTALGNSIFDVARDAR